MSAPSLSHWEYLRMRLHLASVGETQRVRQALWLGAPAPAGAVILLTLLKALLLALFLLATFFGLRQGLGLAREIRAEYGQALAQALSGSSASSANGLSDRTRSGGTSGGPSQASREHRAIVEFLFSQETQQTIQKRHDLWQERFGDAAYRGALKPLAAGRAGRAYLGAVLSGRAGSPLAFAREISPEDLERFSLEAEGDFMRQDGPMGRQQKEALKSAWSHTSPGP